MFPSCWASWTRGDWEAVRTPPVLTSTPAPVSGDSDDKRITGGYLAAVIVAAILGAVVLGGLVWLIWKRRQNQRGPSVLRSGGGGGGGVPLNNLRRP